MERGPQYSTPPQFEEVIEPSGRRWLRRVGVDELTEAANDELVLDEGAINEFGPQTDEQRSVLRAVLALCMQGVGKRSRKVAQVGVLAGVLAAAGYEVGQRTADTDEYAYNTVAPTMETTPGYPSALAAIKRVPEVSRDESFDNLPLEQVASMLADTEAELLSEFDREVLRKQNTLESEDVARTFEQSQQPGVGTHGMSRMDFAKQAMELDLPELESELGWEDLPEPLRARLAELLPGWIGQESRFFEERKSRSKAVGPLQQKQIAVDDVRTGEVPSQRYDTQIGIAKDLMVKNYRYLKHYAGEEKLLALREQFPSEESFWADFMAPLLLTPYNAGGTAAGKELGVFLQNTEKEDLQTGPDLLLQFLQNSDLSEEAKEYALKVLAMKNALYWEEKRRKA